MKNKKKTNIFIACNFGFNKFPKNSYKENKTPKLGGDKSLISGWITN